MDRDATGIVLTEEVERTLQLLNVALRVSSKLTYTSWIQYFRDDKGQRKEVIVEALLSYRGSRPKGYTFVFSMAIRLRKGEKLALGLLYIESLYVRLEECVNNIFTLCRST